MGKCSQYNSKWEKQVQNCIDTEILIMPKTWNKTQKPLGKEKNIRRKYAKIVTVVNFELWYYVVLTFMLNF